MKKLRNILLVGCGVLLTACVMKPATSFETSNTGSSVEDATSSSEDLNSEVDSATSENVTSQDGTSSSNQTEGEKPVVDSKITKSGVFAEGAYAEWQDNNASKAKVEYKLQGDSSYVTIDSELVRQNDSNTARFDALGLKAGTYEFKITSSANVVMEMKNITITNYDRSGYAHFNTSSVGGYNNDGTVKSGATIVYVDDNNKNTVQATINGKKYTGLSSILQNQKGSNPLIVRIIGRVNAATWNEIKYTKGSGNLSVSDIKGANGKALPTNSDNLTEEDIIKGGYNTLNTKDYTKLDGLTNKIKYSNSNGGEFDSYYNMLDISYAKNVTVEGVGENAMIFQWGFTWKSCSNIEVRNLIFDDYTEDACAFEGPDDATTLSGFTTGHLWIHNNQFNEGKNYWDVCPEQDKLEGDGATDLKKNAYITLSYNHYINNHKTGLVGGGDSQHTAAITFHHNFYDQCSQRLPLGRQANMHMYNNYYYKATASALSIRAGGYAFVEGSYFEGCKDPMETKNGDGKKGVIKSYQNTFDGCNGTNNGVVVNSRDQKVDNDNIYDKNFDTNPTNFYYDATNKVSNVSYLTSASQAKIDAKTYAGPLHTNPLLGVSTPTDPTPTPTPEPTGEKEVLNAAALNKADDTYTSSISSGIFKINATQERTIAITNNISYYAAFDKTYTSEIKLSGTGTKDARSISFTISKAAKIKIIARSANTSAERQLAIYDSSSKEVKRFDPIIGATELTYTLESGSYYIASVNSGMNVAAVILEYTK